MVLIESDVKFVGFELMLFFNVSFRKDRFVSLVSWVLFKEDIIFVKLILNVL